MSSNFRDYYNTLGLSQNAEADQIKAAYRRLAFKWHPDLNQSNDAVKMMQALNEAFLILGNPEARIRYDEEYIRYKEWCSKLDYHFVPTTPSKPPPVEDYIVVDEILRGWMEEALKSAREMGHQAITDACSMLSGAGKSAATEMLMAFIGFVFIGIVFSLLAKGCN